MPPELDVRRIGENLKTLCWHRGVNRYGLASFLGVSYSTIAKYMSGARIPDAVTLARLAARLGVSSELLLGELPEEMRGKTMRVLITVYNDQPGEPAIMVEEDRLLIVPDDSEHPLQTLVEKSIDRAFSDIAASLRGRVV